jgi:hypothetical protein
MARFGSWEKNIYYAPEKVGMKILAQVEHEPNYDFDILLFLEDLETGKFYAAQDAGCSCPTPFENFRGLEDLAEIRKIEDIEPLAARYGTSDKLDFLNKVREYL